MILVIVGPTGVGKTRLSIELAKHYKAIIINADAMQIYEGMNIGTAKIKEEEKEGIKHYLFDVSSINDNYTVYNYQKDVRKIIDDNKNKNIIMVGGSGLYIKAALYNYVFKDEEKKSNNYDDLSNEELYNLALQKNSNINIHPHNRQRLIRFLNKDDITKEECYPLYKAIYVGLTTDRDTLYERINKRVLEMVQEGLLDEVKSLYQKNKNSLALHTAIGYKEIIKYLNNEISLDEAIKLIQSNSRHYAKRQYTWFNNQMPVEWFNTNFTDFNKTIQEIIHYIDTLDVNEFDN